MFRTFADVQTADMLKLPRPTLKAASRSRRRTRVPELKAFVQTLVDRAQRLSNGGVDPRVDNMLKITGDGRKAALDMRLVGPRGRRRRRYQNLQAIDRIHHTWEATQGEALNPACLLRPLDTASRPIQRL